MQIQSGIRGPPHGPRIPLDSQLSGPSHSLPLPRGSAVVYKGVLLLVVLGGSGREAGKEQDRAAEIPTSESGRLRSASSLYFFQASEVTSPL